MPKQRDELTVEEAAHILERTPCRVRQLIADRTLDARHEGEGLRKTHYLPRTSVMALLEKWRIDPPQAGWRKGRKRKIAGPYAE